TERISSSHLRTVSCCRPFRPSSNLFFKDRAANRYCNMSPCSSSAASWSASTRSSRVDRRVVCSPSNVALRLHGESHGLNGQPQTSVPLVKCSRCKHSAFGPPRASADRGSQASKSAVDNGDRHRSSLLGLVRPCLSPRRNQRVRMGLIAPRQCE